MDFLKSNLKAALDAAFFDHHANLHERDEEDAETWLHQMRYFDETPADPDKYLPKFLEYCQTMYPQDLHDPKSICLCPAGLRSK